MSSEPRLTNELHRRSFFLLNSLLPRSDTLDGSEVLTTSHSNLFEGSDTSSFFLSPGHCDNLRRPLSQMVDHSRPVPKLKHFGSSSETMFNCSVHVLYGTIFKEGYHINIHFFMHSQKLLEMVFSFRRGPTNQQEPVTAEMSARLESNAVRTVRSLVIIGHCSPCR